MKHIFLDLGRQPLANGFREPNQQDPEFFFDLKVLFDDFNYLVSLENFVQPELMFNDQYAYTTSNSETMCRHFAKLAYEFNLQYNKVLEIGSNDGAFIKHFKQENAVAVEPCKNFAEITRQLGYRTYDSFWNFDLSEQIVRDFGLVDVVYSANCMCHIPDLIEAFHGVAHILKSGGQFIFEDPSLLQVIKNNAFDQFYDEHAHIFSLTALQVLLNEAGMTIVDVKPIPTHGGSNRVIAQHINSPNIINKNVERMFDLEAAYKLHQKDTFIEFAKRVEHNKKHLVELVNNIRDKKYALSGYGATSKSTVVYNYCGIEPDFITDTTPNKQGKLMPGIHTPIISPESRMQHKDYVFLGAWNFMDEILVKERFRQYKFITHIPQVTIL